jgi:peptidyl-prolyl cis-trans isomerase SurA
VLPPLKPAAAFTKPPARRDSDPLLGPDPDLMPPIPDIADMKSAAKPAAPTGPELPLVKPPAAPSRAPDPVVPVEKSPGDSPSLSVPAAPVTKSRANVASPADLPIEPAPAAGAGAPNQAGDPAVPPKAAVPETAPAGQKVNADKSTAVRTPASANAPAELPPLEPAPTLDKASPAVSARAAVPGPAPQKHDPQIVRTSAHDAPGEATDRRRLPLEPGCPIARVGDEIITYHDLVLATRERLPKNLLPHGQEFNSEQQIELINQINRMRIDTLESLIERSMLFQEAKRHIKDPKLLNRIYEDADRFWYDNEILPLQREYNVDNEQQLKERLARQGRSLDAMHQSFRQLSLCRGYLHEKLKDRINVELPDLLKYYNEHVNKHEFDRSAQISWRELVVEVSKHESRPAARRRADELLKALEQGEDFAKLARAQSDGPTGSRTRGGLMETSPGGYAIAAVNQAIESLPIGQLSGVIEGPDSFHIVKVERRRPAGPASFEEVQDKIKPIVQNQKFQAESAAYINKLRRQTPITIYSPTRSKKPQD